MFRLRDRLKELGLLVKNGKVYLDDPEVDSNQKESSNS